VAREPRRQAAGPRREALQGKVAKRRRIGGPLPQLSVVNGETLTKSLNSHQNLVEV
jgi:hypothetical protein